MTMVDKLYPSTEDLDHQKEMQKKMQRANLRGKTIEVYEYMISEGKIYYGVREIQRDLGYSSPSIASYHLNRLCEYELVNKSPDGMYSIDGDPVRLGSVETHVRVIGLMVPRLLLHGVNGMIAILVALLLYASQASTQVWLFFVILSNLVFISMVIKDSMEITGKLKVQEKDTS